MSEGTLYTVLTVIGAAGTVLFGYVLYMLHKRLKERDAAYVCPHLKPGYRGDVPADAKDFRSFCLMMVPALAEASIVLLVCGHNMAKWPWMESAMAVLCAVMFVSGSAETLLWLKKAGAARVCSYGKWASVGLWLAGLFVSLIVGSVAMMAG